MKKIIFSLMIIIFLFTGCNKRALTGDKFSKLMEKKEFKIHDVIDQYDRDLVTSALVASNDKGGYQIEFLSFKSVDSCKNSFQINRSQIRENMKDDDKEYSVSKEDYSKYTLTTNDTYYVVSRVKSGLIYLTVDGSYKKDVDKILNELGF